MSHELITLCSLALASLSLLACPAGECEDGANRCEGELVQHCHDGVWEEAEECDAGQTCMAMDDGTEHCMAGT